MSDVKTVERKLSLTIMCICDFAMHVTEDGLVACKNEHCDQFNVKYKAPTVKLEPAES